MNYYPSIPCIVPDKEDNPRVIVSLMLPLIDQIEQGNLRIGTCRDVLQLARKYNIWSAAASLITILDLKLEGKEITERNFNGFDLPLFGSASEANEAADCWLKDVLSDTDGPLKLSPEFLANFSPRRARWHNLTPKGVALSNEPGLYQELYQAIQHYRRALELWYSRTSILQKKIPIGPSMTEIYDPVTKQSEYDLLPSAVGLLLTDLDQSGIWLSRREDPNRSFFGYYQTPGGLVEQGETEHDALKREFKEECGNINFHGLVSLKPPNTLYVTPEGKLYRALHYTAYTQEQPVHTEPEKKGLWQLWKWSELSNIPLMESTKDAIVSLNDRVQKLQEFN